ncbi:MAG: hypothetical protein JSV56_07205 [Methanomassiliicoccales archaeon]|nr:MAG: hypothetical protein JSV56_07205 [Methanomassiliicoccales archaeon]
MRTILEGKESDAPQISSKNSLVIKFSAIAGEQVVNNQIDEEEGIEAIETIRTILKIAVMYHQSA